ncbi:fimbrial protein [Moellerella wisconsensis]|uniref:Fimbrial protein n=1 Tax=Moellerella wisconsensis TaxID=158849 RepID=A0A9Q8V444_9GAMM|nr:fimbrial protein [Moellerella wisconsensis]KLN95739.1 hypothetical protein VK86_13715 [Moellerella wisconsensis]UNH24308.1 fimbrial protein [Moellerella wisconsensis]UNH27413.1 fimbrial protein [Moellerella wisconsensis]UNH30887.1 fimbrial protein [Moellerella wisconsensis]UNH42551.1 fimbrial protein [Moellerella wisconsensis]
MKSLHLFLALCFTLGCPLLVQASCNNTFSEAPQIIIDVSDKLYLNNSVTETYQTLYNGSIYCDYAGLFKQNKIVNISGLESKYLDRNIYLKLNNKNILEIKVLDISKREIILNKEANTYNANQLNTEFIIKISAYDGWVNPSNIYDAHGNNQALINNLIIATDDSDIKVFTRFLKDLWVFITTFRWPIHNGDLFSQSVVIKFNNKETTCKFTNAGTTVTLPEINRTTLLSDNKTGITPFSLDFNCSFTLNNKTSNPIKAYLSSAHLTNDKKIMIDPSHQAAKGVGIGLSYLNNAVVFSSQQGQQEKATLLVNKKEGDKLENNFSLNLQAYYQVYNKNKLSAGQLNTTAIVNLDYF